MINIKMRIQTLQRNREEYLPSQLLSNLQRVTAAISIGGLNATDRMDILEEIVKATLFLGDYTNSLKYCLELVSLSEKQEIQARVDSARVLLASVYRKKGSVNLAAKLLKPLLKGFDRGSNGQTPEILFELNLEHSKLCLMLGDFKEAYKALREAKKDLCFLTAEHSWRYYLQLATTMAHSGNFKGFERVHKKISSSGLGREHKLCEIELALVESLCFFEKGDTKRLEKKLTSIDKKYGVFASKSGLSKKALALEFDMRLSMKDTDSASLILGKLESLTDRSSLFEENLIVLKRAQLLFRTDEVEKSQKLLLSIEEYFLTQHNLRKLFHIKSLALANSLRLGLPFDRISALGSEIYHLKSMLYRRKYSRLELWGVEVAVRERATGEMPLFVQSEQSHIMPPLPL